MEDLVAPLHHLFAVEIGGVVGKLVNEAAAGVDELGEGGGCPVRDERLVQGGDVRLCRRAGQRRGEACSIVPGGATTLMKTGLER